MKFLNIQLNKMYKGLLRKTIMRRPTHNFGFVFYLSIGLKFGLRIVYFGNWAFVESMSFESLFSNHYFLGLVFLFGTGWLYLFLAYYLWKFFKIYTIRFTFFIFSFILKQSTQLCNFKWIYAPFWISEFTILKFKRIYIYSKLSFLLVLFFSTISSWTELFSFCC